VICRILDVPRSTAYYREHDHVTVVDEVMAQRVKHLIDAEPYLGYRMVWARLRRHGFKINRKAVQRIMQVKGWQCHRRLKKRCSPRVERSTSVAKVSDVRWATDATYVWTRLEGLVYVNAVIDCADREGIGLNVSQRNNAREAAWALEDALIRRFGVLPKGDANVILRTDNAVVYASELYRSLAKSYGLAQEFILPHTPEQNGVAESFMGTLKLECAWQQRFDTYDAAKASITAWVTHYNESRPHSRLGYLTPVAWREAQAREIRCRSTAHGVLA
jgi:putative transposase